MRGLAYAIPPSIVLWMVIIMLSSASAHDGIFIGFGVGKHGIAPRNTWDDHGEIGTAMELGYSHSIGQWVLEAKWLHQSQLMAGEPFDVRQESHLDSAYVWGRYYF